MIGTLAMISYLDDIKYWNINIWEKFKKKWPYNFNPNKTILLA